MSNHLAGQTSPYLLEHAENPVDWFPWGAEALEAAAREAKPIFLSIGYSACHWCHVMAAECFQDAEIARLLKENFISIKVDREERPDLDQVYMEAVQWLTGGGGWPMSVFLTPERTPFYGGTYWPPHRRDKHAGLRRGARRRGCRLGQTPRRSPPTGPTGPRRPPGRSLAGRGRGAWPPAAGSRREGPDRGLRSPRRAVSARRRNFPNPLSLCLLLRLGRQTGKQALLDMVDATLQHMARGGIYDQLGGGFHRYSVDAQWLVPHFEKMLYDNALLAACYTRGLARHRQCRSTSASSAKRSTMCSAT